MKVIRDAIGMILFVGVMLVFLTLMAHEVQAYDPFDPHTQQMEALNGILREVRRINQPQQKVIPMQQLPRVTPREYPFRELPQYERKELPPLDWEKIEFPSYSGKPTESTGSGCVEKTIDHDGIVVYRQCQ